jgi:hypothetical protein
VAEGSTDIVVAADSGSFSTVQVTVAEQNPFAVPPKPDKKGPKKRP